jgi:hypothetical protein
MSGKLLIALVSTVLLGSESRRSQDHVYSLIRRLTAKLLLALASTEILYSESHGTHDHVLLSDGSGSIQLSPALWFDSLFQSSILLLALTSTVVLGFEPRRDPWPYFYSFQTFTCFEMGPPFRQEVGSDYCWSLQLYCGVTLLALALICNHSNTLTHSTPTHPLVTPWWLWLDCCWWS